MNPHAFGSLLFDLERDSGQEHHIKDAAVEAGMIGLLKSLMQANQSPAEQFERLGL